MLRVDTGVGASAAGEVYRAHEHPRCPVQEFLVQVLGIEVGPVDVKWVLEPGVVDAVGVLLLDAGADGVEVLRHLEGLLHRDVLRRVGVDGEGEPVHGNAALRAEVGDVVLRVDTGVGASAAGEVYRAAADVSNGLLQGPADGDRVLLHLPPVVGGAVVHEFQGNVAHKLSFGSSAARGSRRERSFYPAGQLSG